MASDNDDPGCFGCLCLLAVLTCFVWFGLRLVTDLYGDAKSPGLKQRVEAIERKLDVAPPDDLP